MTTLSELAARVTTLDTSLTAAIGRIDTLNAEISTLKITETETVAELNTFYLMWAGALIFLMQSGFAVLSAGSIRAKNVKNILLKNLLDACMGALAWYFLGYSLAFDVDDRVDGHMANAFIGGGPTHFALSGVKDNMDAHAHGYDWISFFFQYAFAAAAATIVSGAVAERCKLNAYLIYTVVITAFIYPCVVHWVWDSHGFLCAGNPKAMMSGVIDFAGSGVVHMTGGWAALMGAYFLGPRMGRFTSTVPGEFEGHSATLQVLGTFILWFGWYGFNPGSTLGLDGLSRDMARSAVTTTLSAATGGVTGLFVKKMLPAKLGGNGVYDLGHTCNSLLGGLVGITAGCASVPVWASIIIGFCAAFVYHGASCLMRKLKIDDPLDAFAVHGACGFWGLIAVGLFTAKEYSYAPAEGNSHNNAGEGYDAGLFMPGTRGILFATQLCAGIIMILWVTTMSGILFFSLKMCGMLRVDRAEEDAGADVSKHGGSAYPEQMPMVNGAACTKTKNDHASSSV